MKSSLTIPEIAVKIEQIRTEIAKRIIGQDVLVRNILIAIFAEGHILLEGVPGLAKTFTVETISKTL